MFVLRKSFGAYSAGTRITSQYEPGREFLGIDGIKIPAELIVQRRNMTVMRPNVLNSRERRAIKRSERKRLLEVQNANQ